MLILVDAEKDIQQKSASSQNQIVNKAKVEETSNSHSCYQAYW